MAKDLWYRIYSLMRHLGHVICVRIKDLGGEISTRMEGVGEEMPDRMKDLRQGLLSWMKRILKAIPFRVKAVVIVLLVLFLGSFLYTKGIYGGRWMKHTTINGVDLSGKAKSETEKLLPDGGDYSLTITGRDGGQMTIQAEEIDYEFIPDGKRIDQLFRKQHAIIRFPWTSRNYKVGWKNQYDEEKLSQVIDQCLLIKGSEDYPIEKPVSADIIFSEKEGKPVVKKESYGNTLNKKAFIKAIKKALDKESRTLRIDSKKKYPDMYQEPAVTSDSKEIEQGLVDYKTYINRYLCWDIWEGETWTIKPEQIQPMAYYAEGKMHCRIYKLEKLLQKLCKKYQTAGKPRIFTSHKGKKVKITKGDYGWKLDFAKIVDQAQTALEKKIDEKDVDRYIENPSDQAKEKVTIHLKPQYKTEAWTRDNENYQDWDPNTYTEVSIAEQMIYVHRKGKIAFKCKTISGLPVEGRETGKGVYYVKGRSMDRVLRGDDYETPVKYWIRLTESGTGFHAAPWQKWDKWSKTYYKKHGSHGCLNLSDKNAAKMYDILEKGEAVFIY